MLDLRLFKRKTVSVPTLGGWLLIVGLLALVVLGGAVATVPFLAPVRPMHQGILVVEGWLPDYALQEAKTVFETHSYRALVLTGVPVDQGYFLTEEKNYAQLATKALQHLGMKKDVLVPVACPEMPRNRTYATARKVKDWLETTSMGDSVDIFTLGVHARRTWLLYRMALGKKYHTGVIAGRDNRFDGRRWWTSSSGFRTVTSEMIAYLYAKLCFLPPTADPMKADP
jgi:hypothetical protein